MRSSAFAADSHFCSARLPPHNSKRLLASSRSLIHVVHRSSRHLHKCICTQAAGATAQAGDSQHLSGDVVLQDGNLVHAAEVANVSKPILSGGGGGIFFFWQLGRSLYSPPKVLSQQSSICMWDLHPKATPSLSSSFRASQSKSKPDIKLL